MEILLIDKGDGGEFVLEGGDLKQDGTFLTALYLSLFNGDAYYNIFSDYPTNRDFENALSLPLTIQNLNSVETLGKNALKWMLEQGVAKTIDVNAYGDKDEKINVEITITEPDGTSGRYYITWQNEKIVLTKGVNRG